MDVVKWLPGQLEKGNYALVEVQNLGDWMAEIELVAINDER